jgi:hypothetical protein
VRYEAHNPDDFRQLADLKGAASNFAQDVQQLLYTPVMIADPKLHPQQQAGHHRICAVDQWGQDVTNVGLSSLLMAAWIMPRSAT